MSVTIADVARRAQLNPGSVSRILNGKGAGYSAATRQRVFDTAAEMGYQPNMLARALQTGQTNTVALWLLSPEYYSPYFGHLQHHLQRIGSEHNYQMIMELVPLLVANAQREPQLVNWPVDGVICSYLTLTSASYWQAIANKKRPVVCMQQRRLEGIEFPNIDYVLIDVYSGALQAVEHLLTAGCNRVAFLGPDYAYADDPRASAYREAMTAAGKAAEFIESPEAARQDGYTITKAYVAQYGCPQGLFCYNDELAIGCQAALSELGIQVPDDALLVGFDGLENVRLCACPITSVGIPIEKMCAAAWKLLLERIEKPDIASRELILPTQLEIRASSVR